MGRATGNTHGVSATQRGKRATTPPGIGGSVGAASNPPATPESLGLTSKTSAREPNEGLRRHKLMTKELRKAFAETGSQEGKGHDATVIAKFFNPYGNSPWDKLYVTEFDGEDTLFGYCVSNNGPDCDEWGYSSLNEIASATLPSGTPAIERDIHFPPRPLRECDGALRKDGANITAAADIGGSSGKAASGPDTTSRERVVDGITVTEEIIEWGDGAISVDYVTADGMNLWEDIESHTSFDEPLSDAALLQLLAERGAHWPSRRPDHGDREFRYPRKYNGEGIVKDFRRLLETGDVNKLSPRLYDFLTMSGGYIAHFNLGGFRGTYEGKISELLNGEMMSLTSHDPRQSPYRARLAGVEEKLYGGGVPWQRSHLEDSGYKDGLSAADVMAEVCAVACELEYEVRLRERTQRRSERINAMRAIADAEGFTVSPSEE